MHRIGHVNSVCLPILTHINPVVAALASVIMMMRYTLNDCCHMNVGPNHLYAFVCADRQNGHVIGAHS